MKVEIEISENKIPTLIGQAAKHNNVSKAEVTNEMFEEELGKALKYDLYEQVSEAFHANIEQYKIKAEEENTRTLLNRADINLKADDGIILKVEDEPEYVFLGDDELRMRVKDNISIGLLVSELNIDSSAWRLIDWVDQRDGTTLFKYSKNN